MIIKNQTWKKPKTHFIEAIDNVWYKRLVDIENLISKYTYLFYSNKDIKTMHIPITTGSISSPMGLGSDSLPVKIKLGGCETYLADSMQFALEYGCRFSKNGMWYIMPSFRGEKEDERHLSQFYHSEAEIPGTLEDIIKLVEEYLKYLCTNILKDYKKELLDIVDDVNHIEQLVNMEKFPRITFDEAVEILRDKKQFIEHNDLGFRNITTEGEKELIKYFNGIVWVTNYDAMAVPFYQNTSEDGKKAINADLLLGIGETVGLGERHSTGSAVRKALKKHNVDTDEYNWYIEMKDKYPLVTSGFGMGIERFILFITKHNDIRDCQIMPRFIGKNIIP